MMSKKMSNQLIKMLCRLGRHATPQVTLCRGRVLGQQLARHLGSTHSLSHTNLQRLCQRVCQRSVSDSFPVGTYPRTAVPLRCYYSTQVRLKEKQSDEGDGDAEDRSGKKLSAKLDSDNDTEGKLRGGISSSTSVDRTKVSSADVLDPPEHMTVFKRFKLAYKEYGKVLIAVHVSTSLVWYSTFVYAASVGVDVVPLLEWLGAGQTIISPFKSSGLGNLAVGYLMYKLATPARYTVTLGGTQMMVRYLRKTGYMEPVKDEDRLRNLVKEGSVKMKDKREELKDKYEDWRDDMKDKREELKDKYEDWRDDMKEKVKDKAKEMQDPQDKKKKDT